jgi:hypothetical protein
MCFGQPVPTDYCAKLSQAIRGTPRQKERAGKALRKYCALYGVKERDMYYIIKQESEGKLNAFNHLTEARGLCQLTEYAIRDIPEGNSYYTIIKLAEHRRAFILNKRRVYRIEDNIRGGCSYFSRCRTFARRTHHRLPWTWRLIISKKKLTALYYVWGIQNVREMFAAVDYARKFY